MSELATHPTPQPKNSRSISRYLLTHPALRWLMNHNPFYVISAVLVLYGIHRSFHGAPEASESWTLMKLLGGYSLLLAISGALIVRLGQVWEDARTVLLLIVLIFVAMSSSFDEICLFDPGLGARFLGAGLLFCATLTEVVLRLLRIRLSGWYRIPFYAQLILLFAFPPWLAHLLLSDRQTEMSWFVMAFPTIAAATCLMLYPAAAFGAKIAKENGTPWSWPWFPWPLFVFVCLGFCLRAYSLTVCFELELGLVSGFQPFWLIPIGLAAAFVALEIGLQGRYQYLTRLAMWAPMGLILPAGFSAGSNEMQTWYADQIRDHLGNPLLLTLVALAIYYTYAALRKVPSSESLLMMTIGGLAFVRADEIGWATELAPYWALIYALVTVLAWRSVQKRSSWRMAAAIIIALAFESYRFRGTSLVASHGYCPLHFGIIGLLALPLWFNDWLSRQIQTMAVCGLPVLATVAVVAYRWLFPDVEVVDHAVYLTGLSLLAVGHWNLQTRLRQAIMVLWVAAAMSIAYFEAILHVWSTDSQLEGGQWIAWGLVCLALACVISLAKARSGPSVIRTIAEWNDRASRFVKSYAGN